MNFNLNISRKPSITFNETVTVRNTQRRNSSPGGNIILKKLNNNSLGSGSGSEADTLDMHSRSSLISSMVIKRETIRYKQSLLNTCPQDETKRHSSLTSIGGGELICGSATRGQIMAQKEDRG